MIDKRQKKKSRNESGLRKLLASSLCYQMEEILTPKFLEKVFQNNFANSQLKIIKFEKNALQDNYFASLPIRVCIQYEIQTKDKIIQEKESLMIKLFPKLPEEEKKKFQFLFENENDFYSNIWPKFERFLSSIKGHPFQHFVPKYYSVCSPSMLILTDLSQYGFRNAIRLKRLDLPHCQITLKALALFHAFSLKLKETEGLPNEIPEEIRADKFFKTVYPNCLVVLAEQVAHWPGYQHYAEKLLRLSKSISQRIQHLLFSGSSQLTVLNHGDLWLENILFHYPENSSQPDSVSLIDFQFCKVGSPALDLLFFLYSSSRIDVLMNDFDTLISFYLNEVHQALAQLNLPSDIFPRDKLLSDIHDAYLLGVLNSFTVQVATQVPYGSPMPFMSLMDGSALEHNSDWRQLIACNPSVREYIENVLDQANQRGIFY